MDNNEIKLQLMAEKKALKEANDKIGRPFLINRMLCGLLDFLSIIVLSVVFFFAIFSIFYKSTYDTDLASLKNTMKESYLYVEKNNNYYQLKYNTDSSKTAFENYDQVLVNYYTNIDTLGLSDFNLSKENSNLFVNNVLKDGVNEEDVLSFYEAEYDKALSRFTSNSSEYTFYTFKIFYNILLELLIAFFISSTIFYLLIPLLSKEGETIFQRIFKICLLDRRDNSIVKKYQIVIRYLATVFINVYLPIILLAVFNLQMYSFVPIIISLFLMALTKNNRALQDYISFTDIINKNRQKPTFDLKGK